MPDRRGNFIVFEGIDFSGKSTQAALFAKKHNFLLTKEPGGTAFGIALRDLLLNQRFDIDAEIELLLLTADRLQHLNELVIPELDTGHTVVSDRFFGSTLAYQGYGSQIDRNLLLFLHSKFCGNLTADLTFYLDIDFSELKSRAENSGRSFDRIEIKGVDYVTKVLNGYKELAQELNWAVIDGNSDIKSVSEQIEHYFTCWLKNRG
jgi:dTMP kinase